MALAKAQCHCEVCGRDFEVRVKRYDSTAASEFKTWAEENITICRDCQFEAKKKEEHERALKCSDGLPELKGTAKQIAWAFDIRGKFVDIPERNERGAKLFREVYLYGKTSAEWWIDHRRSNSARDLIDDIRYGLYGEKDKDEYREALKIYFADVIKNIDCE